MTKLFNLFDLFWYDVSMQQLFQCYRCGAQNYIGQAYCWNCHEKFQYYCPWCNSPVEVTYTHCSNCRAPLPWPAQQSPDYQLSQLQGKSWQTYPAGGHSVPQIQADYNNIQTDSKRVSKENKPVWRSPWVIAAACLILVAAITLAVFNIPGVIKQPGNPFPGVQLLLNQPAPNTGPTDNEF